MANPVLQKLVDEVNETKTVVQSAVVLINGIKTRIDEAVAKALENGATEGELAPLTDLAATLDTDTNSLAAAISANTPTP